MAIDKREWEEAVKVIKSMIEEIGYLWTMADENEEPKLARHFEIADVALRNAIGHTEARLT